MFSDRRAHQVQTKGVNVPAFDKRKVTGPVGHLATLPCDVQGQSATICCCKGFSIQTQLVIYLHAKKSMPFTALVPWSEHVSQVSTPTAGTTQRWSLLWSPTLTTPDRSYTLDKKL